MSDTSSQSDAMSGTSLKPNSSVDVPSTLHTITPISPHTALKALASKDDIGAHPKLILTS
jgi:hypothetical protein